MTAFAPLPPHTPSSYHHYHHLLNPKKRPLRSPQGPSAQLHCVSWRPRTRDRMQVSGQSKQLSLSVYTQSTTRKPQQHKQQIRVAHPSHCSQAAECSGPEELNKDLLCGTSGVVGCIWFFCIYIESEIILREIWLLFRADIGQAREL